MLGGQESAFFSFPEKTYKNLHNAMSRYACDFIESTAHIIYLWWAVNTFFLIKVTLFTVFLLLSISSTLVRFQDIGHGAVKNNKIIRGRFEATENVIGAGIETSD